MVGCRMRRGVMALGFLLFLRWNVICFVVVKKGGEDFRGYPHYLYFILVGAGPWVDFRGFFRGE